MKEQPVRCLLLDGKRILKESGAGEYSLDAELFMMKATGFTKVGLFTKDDHVLSTQEAEAFYDMVEKRKNKMPTQYILGTCQFMGMDFKVTPKVLIPRPDTEVLVETVLEYAKKENLQRIVDIGTGSGCIPISLKAFGVKEAVGVDISAEALDVAKINAESNNVDVKFMESDLFEKFPPMYENYFDAIVSNPPYITKEVIKSLMSEVKDYEPMLALDGGEDGIDFYRNIIDLGRKYICRRGWIFFEIGYDQGEAVSRLMEQNGFCEIKTVKDLAGLDRVVLGRKIGEV